MKDNGNRPNRVDRIRRIFGEGVLLLSWPTASKGTKRKWKHLTLAEMEKSGYLAKLEGGNIGVAQGRVSGGLCSIDIDDDDWGERFLAVNARLATSTRTRGERGFNVWLFCDGEYPRSQVLKDLAGEALGEWRADGCQTIVSGIHPGTNAGYQFLVEAHPVSMPFEEIVWPKAMRTPRIYSESSSLDFTEETEGTEATDGTEVSDDSEEIELHRGIGSRGVCRFRGLEITTIDQLVSACVPRALHVNHSEVLNLARGILSLERNRGSKFSQAELNRAFFKWYALAQKFLRQGQTRDDYLMEFYDAYRRAKYPLGQVTLDLALQLAKSSPLPDVATRFDDPKKRLLVAWCFQLQCTANPDPFYLSSRDCGYYLGISHSTAAQWLGALVAMEIIKEVTKGSQHSRRASRYRYLALAL